MGSKDSSPPAQPDYTAAAAQTGADTLKNTRAATTANRVNQTTPFGSLTYSQTPTYTTDSDSYNAALAGWNANGQQGTKPDVSGYQTLNPDAGWNATTSLNPQEQGLLDTYLKTQGGLSQLQGGVLNQVGSTIGKQFQNTGAPALQGNVNMGGSVQGQPAPGTTSSTRPYQMNGGPSGVTDNLSAVSGGQPGASYSQSFNGDGSPTRTSQGGITLDANGNGISPGVAAQTPTFASAGAQGRGDPTQAQGGGNYGPQSGPSADGNIGPAPGGQAPQDGIVNQINTQGVGGTANGISVGSLPTPDQAYQQKYQDATYQQQAQYLDPQWKNAQDQFTAQMANQGLVPGDEAYNKAYQNFANSKQQAYSNAGMNAITGGLNAENTMFGQGLNAFNANVGAQATNAGIQNQAQQQQYNEAFNNAQFQNAAQQQQFGQGLQNANLANAANQQAFTQNAYQYNLPLNTLNAVMSGSQVQSPTFQNVAQQQTAPGANYLQAAQDQYSGGLNAYNAQQANSSNFMSGLMSTGGMLGSAAIMA